MLAFLSSWGYERASGSSSLTLGEVEDPSRTVRMAVDSFLVPTVGVQTWNDLEVLPAVEGRTMASAMFHLQ